MKQRFAVFDIDGTLVRWQLYHALTDELLKTASIDATIREDLKSMRMQWKERTSDDAYQRYEEHLIQTFENILPHIDVDTYTQAVYRVIDQYKDQVYAYTRDLIAELKQKGYFLIAISGSQSEIVEKLAAHYGFDVCAGSRYIHDGKKFTDKKFIVPYHKKEILEKYITDHNLTLEGSYAVGDSSSDEPMLAMVEHPIAFNPNQSLYTTATKNNWNIVVERKNVVYKLLYDNGEYTLRTNYNIDKF
jgi:HAD superfamily hydrolase (TIGR01490 family)